MSAIAIGWIVFALVLGSALVGMFINSRWREDHLSTDTKDVVKLGVALVATMSALVLSLLIASAKGAFDTRSNQLVQISTNIVLLDRALARYGPETAQARSLLRQTVATSVERFWPTEGARPLTLEASTSPLEALSEKVEALSPQTDAQRELRG